MISEERLKELIEQEATVYDPDTLWQSLGELKLYKHFKVKDDHILWGEIKYENGGTMTCNVPLRYLYENKEEAQFIVDYHCSKTIKFEPPTFEEFEKKIYWECNNVEIVDYYGDEIQVKEMWYGNDDYDSKYFTAETKQQAYYQAVEYAKKLFLGEE